MRYMSDYLQGHLPDQEFLHKEVSTLIPEQVSDIITKSHKNRAIKSNDMGEQLIKIDNAILNKFKEIAMPPSKPKFKSFWLL